MYYIVLDSNLLINIPKVCINAFSSQRMASAAKETDEYMKRHPNSLLCDLVSLTSMYLVVSLHPIQQIHNLEN